MKIKNYKAGFRYVSLAFDEQTYKDLLDDCLDFIFYEKNKMILMPDNITLEVDRKTYEELSMYNNYDVFEIWPDGKIWLRYDNSSTENYFFITGKCNSNCQMCPSTDRSRQRGDTVSIDRLISLAEHIPADASHLTITGGEPFLVGRDFFKFIYMLREKFEETEFLFLTNGRIFAIEEYVCSLKNSIPNNSILAIPVHAANKNLHDFITRSPGSFEQTKKGIKLLLRAGIRIELRIVISKLNYLYLDELAEFIITQVPQIECVSIIAMEMTGNAYLNKDKVWISYREAFRSVSNAIRRLIENEIDVKLYNFPLCTVDSSYWLMCEKSISPEKIRFIEACNSCTLKHCCGGVFGGTIKMERNELEPIL